MPENLVAPENQNAQGKKNSPHKQVSSEKQKTPTWAIVMIAVLFGLLLSLVIWIITHKVDSIDLGMTITPENWFSFLVTLIGILITLFVGFQIFSVVDVQRDLKDTRKMNEKLKTQTEEALNNIRKENMAFAKEQNGFQLKMLEKQNDVTQKVDWDLKEVKKEYWNEITNMKEAVRETLQTQADIKKEMDDITIKWTGILDVNKDFRDALSKAFLFLETTDDRNDHRIFLLLTMIIIREDFSSNNKALDMALDRIISHLKKMTETTKIKNVLQSNSKKLINIKWDKENSDSDIIQQKIYKVINMINEIPDSPQQDGEQK